MDELPPLVRSLVESGYVAKSGNRAKFMVAVKPGTRRMSMVVSWKIDPSEADRAELEQILSATSNVAVNPATNPTAESIFRATKDFLERHH